MGKRGGFSLRGRKIPAWYIVGGIMLAAFGIGIGAGWLTGYVPALISAVRPEPSSTASPTPQVSVSPGPVIPVEPYPDIDRDSDSADLVAGLTSLSIPIVTTGNFLVVPGVDQPRGEGSERWVRIEVEEDLPLSTNAVSGHAMNLLNDSQGWGANGRMSFGRTDGAADIRILFASPQTAGQICGRPHEARPIEIEAVEIALTPPSATPSPADTAITPSPSPSPEAPPNCAEQGIVVVNVYYWAAGYDGFGDDRASSRAWILNHLVGHILGEEDSECPGASQQASVMQDHAVDVAPCTPNGWPNPAPEESEP